MILIPKSKRFSQFCLTKKKKNSLLIHKNNRFYWIFWFWFFLILISKINNFYRFIFNNNEFKYLIKYEISIEKRKLKERKKYLLIVGFICTHKMKTKHLMHDQVNMICCCSLLLRSSLFLLSPSCCKDLLREADVGVLFDCCHLKMRLRLLDVQISRENKGHATATFTTLLLLRSTIVSACCCLSSLFISFENSKHFPFLLVSLLPAASLSLSLFRLLFSSPLDLLLSLFFFPPFPSNFFLLLFLCSSLLLLEPLFIVLEEIPRALLSWPNHGLWFESTNLGQPTIHNLAVSVLFLQLSWGCDDWGFWTLCAASTRGWMEVYLSSFWSNKIGTKVMTTCAVLAAFGMVV